jgi:cell division protein DivIC
METPGTGHRGLDMARAKRRKTKKRQSRFMSMLILVAMIFVCVCLAKKVISMNTELKELSRTETRLEQEIATANVEHDNLVAQEQYMQTDEYIEDVAKSKLGLVYPDEIVIKPAE